MSIGNDQVLLDAATAAATPEFHVEDKVTLSLNGAVTTPIQKLVNGVWVTPAPALELTAAANVILLDRPGTWRLNFPGGTATTVTLDHS